MGSFQFSHSDKSNTRRSISLAIMGLGAMLMLLTLMTAEIRAQASSTISITDRPESVSLNLDFAILQVPITNENPLGAPFETSEIQAAAEAGGIEGVYDLLSRDLLSGTEEITLVDRVMMPILVENRVSLDHSAEATQEISGDPSNTITFVQSGLSVDFGLYRQPDDSLTVNTEIDIIRPGQPHEIGVNRETMSMECSFELETPDCVRVQRLFQLNREDPFELIIVWDFSER